MNLATQSLVSDALDTALAQHVCKLFNVAMSAPNDEETFERFMLGINLAVGVHERLRSTFEPDDDGA